MFRLPARFCCTTVLWLRFQALHHMKPQRVRSDDGKRIHNSIYLKRRYHQNSCIKNHRWSHERRPPHRNASPRITGDRTKGVHSNRKARPLKWPKSCEYGRFHTVEVQQCGVDWLDHTQFCCQRPYSARVPLPRPRHPNRRCGCAPDPTLGSHLFRWSASASALVPLSPM